MDIHLVPGGGDRQLFDLTADPKELVNRAADNPAIVEDLHGRLQMEFIEHNSPYGKDGKLSELPLYPDTERDRRASGRPGLHTEHYHIDVRH